MANPDIQLMGATYQAVSGVTLPVAGGGTATFPFVEGSQTITQNGTVDVTSLAQVIVNVAGGGGSGLVYETGTYSPAEDGANPTISFANSHSTRPFYVTIFDTTGSTLAKSNSALFFSLASWYDYDGTIIYASASSLFYARELHIYKSSSSATAGGGNITSLTDDSSVSGMLYYLTNTGFVPHLGANNYNFRSGRTYKWIAVWKP